MTEHKHRFMYYGGGRVTLPTREEQIIEQRECDCGLVGIVCVTLEAYTKKEKYRSKEKWWQRRSRILDDCEELKDFVLDEKDVAYSGRGPRR